MQCWRNLLLLKETVDVIEAAEVVTIGVFMLMLLTITFYEFY